MIFEVLWESAKRGELLLLEGSLCRWHLRGDGQITIYEIIVLPEYQRHKIGTQIIAYLKQIPDATSIFAKCPVDLPANYWYQYLEFIDEGIETTKTGRRLRLWRYQF